MPQEIFDLLLEKKYAQVKQAIQGMRPADVAELFGELGDEHHDAMLVLFRLLPKELAAEAFAYMDSESQERLIPAITDGELRHILNDLYLDDFVDLVEEMPANVVKRVLSNTSPQNRKLINQYLQYPDFSAGSIMTNEYVQLKQGTGAREAFDVIRATGVDKETIYTCYVISPERKLLGAVSVRELLLCPLTAHVEDIMVRDPIHVSTLTDREEVARLFTKYDMLAMPVVDLEERMVGIITIDDVVDVIQAENTEDFQKMAAMAPNEGTYLSTPVTRLARNRILWLLILMVSSMFTGALLETYEDALAAIPLLITFIPMIMSTSGNCGSQSSTLMIRSLALDEIRPRDFVSAWFKEIRVALLVGAALSGLNFLRIYLQYRDLNVALAVSGTLLITISVAKSMGCAFPLLAKHLKMDPALMASPIITTVTDMASVFVYMHVAMGLLGNRL